MFCISNETCWQRGALVCLLMGLVTILRLSLARGDPGNGSVGLTTSCFDVLRLTDQNLTQISTFADVDDSTTVHIEVLSNIDGLTFAIAHPGAGGTITESNVQSFGGWYRGFEVPETPALPSLLLPALSEPGFHHTFHFPSQGST